MKITACRFSANSNYDTQEAHSVSKSDMPLFNFVDSADREMPRLKSNIVKTQKAKLDNIINYDYKTYIDKIENYFPKDKYKIAKEDTIEYYVVYEKQTNKYCDVLYLTKNEVESHYPKDKYKLEKKIEEYYTIYDKNTNKIVSKIHKMGSSFTQVKCDGNGNPTAGIVVKDGNLKEFVQYQNELSLDNYDWEEPKSAPESHIALSYTLLDNGGSEYIVNKKSQGDYQMCPSECYLLTYPNGKPAKLRYGYEEEFQYAEDGTLLYNAKKNGEKTYYNSKGIAIEYQPSTQAKHIYPIAENLYNDIHAFKYGILPTTGCDFKKHINQIDTENVWQTLIGYEEKTGKNSYEDGKDAQLWNEDSCQNPLTEYWRESLFRSISNEIGIPEIDRIKYCKHILNALKDCSVVKNNGFSKKVEEMIKFADKLNIDSIDKIFEEIVYKNQIRAKIREEYPHRDGSATAPTGIIDENSLIEQFAVGDCWLLTEIKALTSSSKGKKLLRESLKVLSNGDVEVTLKGVNKTYLITKEELNSSIEYGRNGDVRALEIAVDRYRKENGKSVAGGFIGDGLFILGATTDTAGKYRSILRRTFCSFVLNDKLNELKEADSSKLGFADIMLPAKFVGDKSEAHQIYITKVDDNTVEYFDPHYKNIQKLSIEKFKEYCIDIKIIQI